MDVNVHLARLVEFIFYVYDMHEMSAAADFRLHRWDLSTLLLLVL